MQSNLLSNKELTQLKLFSDLNSPAIHNPYVHTSHTSLIIVSEANQRLFNKYIPSNILYSLQYTLEYKEIIIILPIR